jgi:uncharacterized protein YjdB
VANGSAKVTASIDGVSGSASITVAQEVATVKVTPTAHTLVSLGETAQLTASTEDANRNSISGKTFTWSSSDESVATVSSSGMVTAVANGAATVTAMTDGVGGAADVTVAQEVASVAVTPATADLASLGETAQLAAGALDANGNTIPDKTFAWSSSDETVATISTSGMVTSVANGAATITATTDGVDGTADITVAQEVATVTVAPDAARPASVGETVQLAASAQDANDNAITRGTFTWASSDESVAMVSSSGLVTAVADGSATVTASTDGVSDSASITVAQEVATVEVTPAADTLVSLEETVQLSGAAFDANDNAVSDKTFTWKSTDEGVATVDAFGVAIAVGNGSTTISATTDGVSGSASLMVTAPQSDLVPLSLARSPTSGSPGTTVNVSFTVDNQAAGLAIISVPSLAGGANQAVSQDVTIPAEQSAGAYYIWVILDVNSTANQSDESNDYASTSFTVTAPQSDLVPLSLARSPTSGSPGTTVNVSFTVDNQAAGRSTTPRNGGNKS